MSDDLWERIEQREREEREIRAYAGIPPDVSLWHETIEDADWKVPGKARRAAGSRVEIYGIRVPLDDFASPMTWVNRRAGVIEDVYQIWLQRIYHRDTEAYGEISWRPGRPVSYSLHNLAGAELDGIEKIWRVMDMLRRNIRRGPEMGTGVLADPDAVLAKVQRVIREIYDRTGSVPGQGQVAKATGYSKRQIQKAEEARGIRWGALVRDALK